MVGQQINPRKFNHEPNQKVGNNMVIERNWEVWGYAEGAGKGSKNLKPGGGGRGRVGSTYGVVNGETTIQGGEKNRRQ